MQRDEDIKSDRSLVHSNKMPWTDSRIVPTPWAFLQSNLFTGKRGNLEEIPQKEPRAIYLYGNKNERSFATYSGIELTMSHLRLFLGIVKLIQESNNVPRLPLEAGSKEETNFSDVHYFTIYEILKASGREPSGARNYERIAKLLRELVGGLFAIDAPRYRYSGHLILVAEEADSTINSSRGKIGAKYWRIVLDQKILDLFKTDFDYTFLEAFDDLLNKKQALAAKLYLFYHSVPDTRLIPLGEGQKGETTIETATRVGVSINTLHKICGVGMSLKEFKRRLIIAIPHIKEAFEKEGAIFYVPLTKDGKLKGNKLPVVKSTNIVDAQEWKNKIEKYEQRKRLSLIDKKEK